MQCRSFQNFPGIGRKTALRLVLHLLRQPENEVEMFGNSVISLRRDYKVLQKVP